MGIYKIANIRICRKRYLSVKKNRKRKCEFLKIKSLKGKLLLSFLLVVVIFAANSAFTYFNLNRTTDTYNDLIHREMTAYANFLEIKALAVEQSSSIRGYLLTGDEKYTADLAANGEKLKQTIDDTLKIVYRDDNIQGLNKIKDMYSSFEEKYVPIVDLAKTNQDFAITKATEEIIPLGREIGNLATELANMQSEHVENTNQQNNATVSAMKLGMIILSAVAAAVAVIISLVVATRIVRPIREVTGVLEKIAEGDLTVEELQVKGQDEVGRLSLALNKTVVDLKEILHQIREASMQVAASSEELTASAEQSSLVTQQIASATQQITVGAEEQIKSVKEVGSTVNHLSVGIEQISASTQAVSSLAEGTTSTTNEGVRVVQEVSLQMENIQKSVQETGKIIEKLGDHSTEIGKIVEVISSIAAQTNLLALNAAIEAARAGEHGRGFAVVADEVRKLAEQSFESASKITDFIGVIRDDINSAVISMEQGMSKISEGVDKTDHAGQAFGTIQTSITTVSGKVQEVLAAVQEMASGSAHIVQSIDVVQKAALEGASASQQNAAATQEQLATVEEIAASAHALSKLAEDLQYLLARFKL